MKSMLVIFSLFLFNPLFVYSQSKKVSTPITNVKVFDGLEANCDSSTADLVNSQRPLIFKLVSSKKSGSTITASIEITFLECNNNKWKINNSRTHNYKFKDSVGQVLTENIKFQKEKILIKDKDLKVIDTIPITEFSKNPLKLSFKIDTNNLPKALKPEEKFVDLILTAEQVKQNPADYVVSEVNWGNFRLFLNKNLPSN